MSHQWSNTTLGPKLESPPGGAGVKA